MIKTLWEELQEQGFTGNYKSVWTDVAYLAASTRHDSNDFVIVCACLNPPRCSYYPNSPGRVMWLLLQQREQLSPTDAAYLQALFRLSPHSQPSLRSLRMRVRLVRERKSTALLP